LSEAGGHYNAGWTRTEAGISIGSGTLAAILQQTGPLVKAVGSLVGSFTTGRFRLPSLERSWCDAAYWLHEALAEPVDSIAVAKLETALEVLLRAESSRGSKTRILTILEIFYGLNVDEPIAPGAAVTAGGFAESLVRDRSRILHGTWSTLNSRLGLTRNALENFVMAVIGRAALELESYTLETSPQDDIDAFLGWASRRAAAKET